jgi:hypothetical protein
MKYARHDLAALASCTRRNLWSALLQEVFVTRSALQGRPVLALAALGDLPDEELAHMRPIVNLNEYELFTQDDYVWSRYRKTHTARRLFAVTRENLAAFNQFNGASTLGEIGQRLAQELGWEEVRAFAFGKGLFLALVAHLVCIPRDPLEPSRVGPDKEQRG